MMNSGRHSVGIGKHQKHPIQEVTKYGFFLVKTYIINIGKESCDRKVQLSSIYWRNLTLILLL